MYSYINNKHVILIIWALLGIALTKLLEYYECNTKYKPYVFALIIVPLIAINSAGLSLGCKIFHLIYFSLLLLAAIIDIEKRELPNVINASLALIALSIGFANFVAPQYFTKTLWHVLFGGFVGFVVAFLIYKLGFILFKKEAFGMGDVKLFFSVGALLGAKSVLPVLFFASVIGVIFHYVKIKMFNKSKNIHEANTIAFVPYVYFAMLIYLVFKKTINSVIGL